MLSTETVDYGTSIVLPAPTKTDYYLTGWDYNGTLYGESFEVVRDAVLVAQWVDILEDFTYTVDGTVITITGYVGTSPDMIIPSIYNGMNIEVIDDSAFSGNTIVKTVTIPNTITHINTSAFKDMTNLETVTIEEGSQLEVIGTSAFMGDTKLTSINIEDAPNLTTIGTRAFSKNNALTIYIPETVTTLGSLVFEYTTIKVYVEAENKPVGWDSNWDSKYQYNSDVDIYIVWNVTSYHVNSEYEYALTNDYTITIIKYFGSEVTYSIPSSMDTYPVTIVDRSAYSGNTSISDLTIPDTITHINTSAFKDMTNLETVTIEEGSQLEVIGTSAFMGDTKLTSINIEDAPNLTTIGTRAFSKNNALTIYIPETVTTLGSLVFEYTTIKVYVEAENKPVGWDSNWDKRYQYSSIVEITIYWNSII